MPAQPEKINGKREDLEALREKVRTKYHNNPALQRKMRASARREARKTLLERKIISESELAESEAEDTKVD